MNAGDMLDALERAHRQIRLAMDAIEADDWIAGCRSIGRLADLLPDVSLELACRAATSGTTQKQIAIALGVPESSLRGLRRAAEERSS